MSEYRVFATQTRYYSVTIDAENETQAKQLAEDVIEEGSSFPYGDHDDLVDSMTMAIMRFRQGGFLPHPEDYEDEKKPPRKMEYY